MQLTPANNPRSAVARPLHDCCGSDPSGSRPLTGKSVAIVSNAGWNIANFRFPIARQLRDLGAKVLAVAPEDDDAQRIRDEGFSLIPLKRLKRSGKSPIDDYRLYRELCAIYRNEQVDLSLHYTIKPVIYGSFAAATLNIPSIAVITGLGYSFIRPGIINRIAKQLYKTSLKHSRRVVFQNPDDLSEFLSKSLVTPSKTRVIRGSGVSTDEFSPFYPNTPPGKPVRLLFVGRLLRDKGIYEFISAANSVRNECSHLQFEVLGGIDVENPASLSPGEVETFSKQNGIIFHGHQSDVKPYIREVDAVVLPSYREGLPRAITEAMAMGKPCITSDAPGCRDTVIDGSNGFLAEVQNAESLAAAFRKFAQLPTIKRRQMGVKSRERAEALFSDHIVLQHYRELIFECLAIE